MVVLSTDTPPVTLLASTATAAFTTHGYTPNTSAGFVSPGMFLEVIGVSQSVTDDQNRPDTIQIAK